MIRFLVVALLLAAACGRAASAADQLTADGIRAFTNAYGAWDGARFDAAVKLFQKACDASSATATNFYWLGVGEFHCALHRLGRPASPANKAAAGAAIEAAAAAFKHAVQLDARQAESHALLATIYGMEISDNWLRAVWLGPRVQMELNSALATGTNDARVEYLLGTGQFFCSTRDAARREALGTLLLAAGLFAAEAKTPPAPLAPRWGRDSCLTFIGACYEKLGQPAEAELYFRQALALHPQDGLAQAGLARVAKSKK